MLLATQYPTQRQEIQSLGKKKGEEDTSYFCQHNLTSENYQLPSIRSQNIQILFKICNFYISRCANLVIYSGRLSPVCRKWHMENIIQLPPISAEQSLTSFPNQIWTWLNYIYRKYVKIESFTSLLAQTHLTLSTYPKWPSMVLCNPQSLDGLVNPTATLMSLSTFKISSESSSNLKKDQWMIL